MRRRKRSGAARATTLIAALMLVGGYLWMRDGDASVEAEPATVRVHRETLERTVQATGVIRPMVGAEIEVGSRISGIVRSIPVQVGEMVEQGDLLVLIDSTELEAQTDQARADLTLAKAQLALASSTHSRATALAQEGILAAEELESARRDLEVASARVDIERARLSSAEIQMGYARIDAPIRGVIAEVSTREGETVAASFSAPTFVTIVDLDRLEVQAYVDETDIGRMSVGQKATFTVDTYPGEDLTGRVTAINPKAALQNGVVNYIVRLGFEPAEGFVLRPEMTAHVELLVGTRADVLTLPRKAIRRAEGRQFVRVARGGSWVDQEVEAGWRTDYSVEIEHGLAEGETVQLNQE